MVLALADAVAIRTTGAMVLDDIVVVMYHITQHTLNVSSRHFSTELPFSVFFVSTP